MSAATTDAPREAPGNLLQDQTSARRAEPALRAVLGSVAALILVLIAFFFIRLLVEALPAFRDEGLLDFVFGADWVPSKEIFGALPLLFGTIVTSVIALLLGVPVAIATALYITELSPVRVRRPLT